MDQGGEAVPPCRRRGVFLDFSLEVCISFKTVHVFHGHVIYKVVLFLEPITKQRIRSKVMKYALPLGAYLIRNKS